MFKTGGSVLENCRKKLTAKGAKVYAKTQRIAICLYDYYFLYR
jgi:hypothetical protein